MQPAISIILALITFFFVIALLIKMHYLRLLSLGSYAASSVTATSSTRPDKPLGSNVNAIDYNVPGASPAELRKGGRGHWRGGGRPPGYGDHPHGPGKCIQIQNTFAKGTNGPGSESAKRAKAVKAG